MRGEDDWQAWLDEHGAALLLLARQYVPDRAGAEDVLQEAFVRFWRSRERALDATAFLFACVRRCALEWLRGERRRGAREQAVARRRPAEALFEPALFEDERRRQIESALVLLPAEQREVVVLKVWGGLTFAQIAEALAVPANTAASRYRYALEHLRRELRMEALS
jgi:RNA polymerase sigma-70 factor (ECF subfamily)